MGTQLIQSGKAVRATDARILFTMCHLQILNDKLNIANRTFSQFYFTPGLPLLVQDVLCLLSSSGRHPYGWSVDQFRIASDR